MIRLLLKEPFRWYVEGLTRPFKHEVDAGAVGVGAVLLQDLQGLDRPVCYYSCKFNKNQVNYSTKGDPGFVVGVQHVTCCSVH